MIFQSWCLLMDGSFGDNRWLSYNIIIIALLPNPSMLLESMPKPTPFLDKLATAKQTCGLYLFENYLNAQERDEYFAAFNNENTAFPWQTKPKLYGQALPQHAYYMDRFQKKAIQANPALTLLDSLCTRIEDDLDVQIFGVYCNRLADSTHHLDWHKDTYGSHILVLSLGSQRTVEWRENKTGAIDSVRPHAGDVYFMPLALNKTHQHRVVAGNEGDGTRISLVFFFKAPKYAKDFQISFLDKMKGFVEDVWSAPS